MTNNKSVEDLAHDFYKDNLPEGLKDYAKVFARVYSALPHTHKNIKLPNDNIYLVPVFVALAKLQYDKELGYGSSWCKRGELDVFFNTARKFDRIENIMLGKGKDAVGEPKIDTVGDLANYSYLWMTYLLRHAPEDFVKWFKNNVNM